MLSKKVIITGSFGVGKTSLFNRFVYSRFDEKYLTTIGVKVDKRTIEIDGREISLLLWDIAGEVRQDKVPKSYFLGTSAVVYVIDLTRPSTFDHVIADLDYLKNTLPKAPVFLVGNKTDLLCADELAARKASFLVSPDFYTSAKTGENVELLFNRIGAALLPNLATS